MAEKLSVQIALEGAAEIERQLADIGKAGQKAFTDITKAADQAGGFRQLDPQDVTAKLKELGVTGAASINKIQAAVTSARRFETVSAAVEGLENGFASLRGGLARVFGLFNQTGDATKRFGIRASEARAGVAALAQGLNAIGASQLGRAATVIANITARFGALAVVVGGIGAAIGIGTVFAQFAKGAEEAAKTLDELAKACGVAFEALSSLQIAFAQGGTSAQIFARELGNLQDKIAAANDGGAALAASMERVTEAALSVKQAQLSLAEAQIKARRTSGQLTESEQRRFDKQRRSLALQEAQARLQRARQQQDEAEANNLDDLVNKFSNLSQGINQTFDPLTTLESKVKAITTLLAKLPAEKQFGKLADIFKNLSLIEQAQIGKALGLSPETITSLSRGGEAIRAMQAEIERLNLSLDELDNADLSKLRSSQSELGALWDALKNKMGALAAPAFTSFWEGLTGRIKELIPQFLSLASSFGKIDFSALGRAVADFALKLARMAVQFAAMLEALGRGDTSAFTNLFQQLGSAIMEQVMSLSKSVGTAFADGLLDSIRAAWAGFDIKKEMDKFNESVLQNWEILKQKLGVSSEGLSEQGAKAGQSFGAGFVGGVKESIKLPSPAELLPMVLEDFRKFGESIAQNWEILKRKLRGGLISPAGAAEAGGGQLGGMDFGPMIAAAEVAAVRIKQIFADAFSQSITLDFSGIVTAAQTAATDVSAAFSQIDIASALTRQIDALIAKFNELARAASAGSGGGGGAGGPTPAPFAHGGLFGGRGTGTSDSNLAWVSRGEHIMPARAVQQPGVLAFLEVLRRSGGNLSRVLDGMGRFALGGMVPRAIPAFAAGGLNGGNHVTIQFPGLPAIGGLRASSDVVDQLQKAAALAQVRSGGRKPSRYS